MRIAVFSDVHGNAVALRAVVTAAQAAGVDAFWVIGDHVANGPQPVESASILRRLPGLIAVRGNTDRYVLTGDLGGMAQHDPASLTAEQRQMIMDARAAHAWTRSRLDAAGHLDWLTGLPLEHRVTLPDGTRVLLVHASPGRDDGRGFSVRVSPPELLQQGWHSCDADLVVVAHTHERLDRMLGGVRVVNVSSVSIPPTPRGACWSLLEATPDGHELTHHTADYDLALVAEALEAADHPTAAWLAGKLGLRAHKLRQR